MGQSTTPLPPGGWGVGAEINWYCAFDLFFSGIYPYDVTTTISWSSGTTTQNLNCSVSLLGDTNNVNFVVISVQARLVAKLQEITSL